MNSVNVPFTTVGFFFSVSYFFALGKFSFAFGFSSVLKKVLFFGYISSSVLEVEEVASCIN